MGGITYSKERIPADSINNFENGNLDTLINEMQNSICVKSQIGVSSIRNFDTEQNKSKEISIRASTSNYKKLGNFTAPYKQPEPEDPVEKSRWKRACISADYRKKQRVELNKQTQSLAECKNMLHVSEEMRIKEKAEYQKELDDKEKLLAECQKDLHENEEMRIKEKAKYQKDLNDKERLLDEWQIELHVSEEMRIKEKAEYQKELDDKEKLLAECQKDLHENEEMRIKEKAKYQKDLKDKERLLDEWQ